MHFLFSAWLAIHCFFGGGAPAVHHSPKCHVISTHVGAALGSTVTETTYRCGNRIVVREVITPNEEVN